MHSVDNYVRFLRANVNFQREKTIALFAKSKGGGVVLHISKICSDGHEDDVKRFLHSRMIVCGYFIRLIRYSL